MPPPATRHNLVTALLDRSPRRAVARAITEGQVDFFGGFREVPPEGRPGWIFRVTSAYRRTWLFALIPIQKGDFVVRPIESVPWEHWLDGGDDPDRYRSLRDTRTPR